MSSSRNIVLVGVSLLVLAAISFALAHVSLGVFALPIALVIAAVKASLVAVFFMGLLKHGGSSVAAVGAALGLVVVLVAFVVIDVETRAPPPRMPPPVGDATAAAR